VDMATYKAEFLSHYFKGRVRPRAAYAMGLIYWWSRLASLVPRMANAVANAPGLSPLLKRAGGVHPDRKIPAFAPRSFRSWFRGRDRSEQSLGRPPVLLWPDTFNNYFHPQAAAAAVEVLEAAGFEVIIPPKSLCCGRPLYDFGMLGLAKRLLRQVLDELRPQIRAGMPLVGLEPSCLATFRDELVNLFPGDQDAQRLAAQACTLAELLDRHAPDFQPPRLEARAVVQRHCHHYAVMGFGPDERLLKDMGLDAEVLNAGCCGMAGSFGFERGDHYEVSVAAGERVLLPRVRDADPDTLVVADGFSCRTQIEQGSGRHPLHLAEVMRLALEGRR
jgi:Fe-S oxidoreductase